MKNKNRQRLTQLNKNIQQQQQKKTPSPVQEKDSKIHAIGFISVGTTDRFGILMRELTKQNGGTFLALPLWMGES